MRRWVKLNRSIFVSWPGSQYSCTHVRSAQFSSTRVVSGYFGYCQISLNTEKIIILPLFFCKSGGLTQWWCYLAICGKITVVTRSCWGGDIIIIKYGNRAAAFGQKGSSSVGFQCGNLTLFPINLTMRYCHQLMISKIRRQCLSSVVSLSETGESQK